MLKYKPEHLGKVIPVDDPARLTELLQIKYDSFSKIYDVCKDSSEEISDLKIIETSDGNESSLSIRIFTISPVLENIAEKIKEDVTVRLTGDIITATV